MMRFILVLCGASALIMLGCGDKKDKGGEGKSAPAAKNVAADDGPKLDCPAFEKKMNECLEPFATAYAKTEIGGMSGRQAVGGPVDEALAAKNFKTVWRIAGVQICSGGDAAIGLPFQKKDPPWKKRFMACDAGAACDLWAPCMATAMGASLNAP